MRKGAGIGIYSFNEAYIYYLKYKDKFNIGILNELTNRKYIPFNSFQNELKEGKFYRVEDAMKRTDELLQYEHLTQQSSGWVYVFQDANGKPFRLINDNTYNLYEKKLSTDSKPKNESEILTFHIENPSYRNLISIQKNGHITCDKRNFK